MGRSTPAEGCEGSGRECRVGRSTPPAEGREGNLGKFPLLPRPPPRTSPPLPPPPYLFAHLDKPPLLLPAAPRPRKAPLLLLLLQLLA